jgi:hypothetical protein
MGSANEAILTLDGAAGDEVFKVVANADAGASLFVMNKQGAVTALTTYRGGPELHLIDKSGTLHRQPANAPDL